MSHVVKASGNEAFCRLLDVSHREADPVMNLVGRHFCLNGITISSLTHLDAPTSTRTEVAPKHLNTRGVEINFKRFRSIHSVSAIVPPWRSDQTCPKYTRSADRESFMRYVYTTT